MLLTLFHNPYSETWYSMKVAGTAHVYLKCYKEKGSIRSKWEQFNCLNLRSFITSIYYEEVLWTKIADNTPPSFPFLLEGGAGSL